jgi:hypothetical protein
LKCIKDGFVGDTSKQKNNPDASPEGNYFQFTAENPV